MKSFVGGFYKVAAIADLARKASVIGKGALQAGKGVLEGAKSSLSVPLGEHLKMKGLPQAYQSITESAKKRGGFVQAMKSRSGRGEIGQAVGKALPSAAAAGGYAYGAKKMYDKTLGSPDNTQGSYYY